MSVQSLISCLIIVDHVVHFLLSNYGCMVFPNGFALGGVLLLIV